MPSEETLELLRQFCAAVAGLEDAINRKMPFNEVMGRDADLANRIRDVTAYLTQLRSRRIG